MVFKLYSAWQLFADLEQTFFKTLYRLLLSDETADVIDVVYVNM
jgi:hypothetical protein